MNSLVRLADEAGLRLAHRRPIVRGAIVGAVFYGSFNVEDALGHIGTLGVRAFFLGLLINLAFGLVAGAGMGAAFGLVLARFRRPGFLAFTAAGVAASAILVVPFVAVVARVFGVRALEVGALVTAALGLVLGSFAWVKTRWGRAAA